MRHGMWKPRGLKVICYANCRIDINNYLAVLPGSKASGKIYDTELNEIMLNSMPNSWIRKACVQGFYCESITLKKDVNMFERMEIVETIYEVTVEPSYKKSTRSDTNRASFSRKIGGEATSSNSYSYISESSGKHRKRYVYHMKDK